MKDYISLPNEDTQSILKLIETYKKFNPIKYEYSHADLMEECNKYYRGYKQGWMDATKKIRNFIKRHCEKWEKEV